MTRYYSESDIIKMSLILYPEETRHELRHDAQVLIMNVHRRNPLRKVMFGEKMAFETLYKLGRFMNEKYPLE